MEEVMRAEDANLSIVISTNYTYNKVIHKIYFYVDDYDECSEALKWVAENYAKFIIPGTRLDCYKVVGGVKMISY